MRTYTLTAHTGNEHTKDNSLESIRSAAEHGADIVEFDLLFRKRKGTGVMRHSRPIPSHCPTFEQGLKEVLKTDLRLNIDVKDTAHLDEAVKLADELGLKGRYFFTGIGEDWVDAVKTQCPGVVYYLNYGIDGKRADDDAYIAEIVAKVKDSGAAGINCNYGPVNAKIVEAFHKAGLQVSVWTVNNIDDFRRFSKMNVDNITTRFPTFENQI